MALRSILDIEVNDESFKRYQEQFKKYTDLLAATPNAWRGVTKEIDASRKSFQELVAAAAARQGYAKLVAEAEAVAARSVEQQARSWGELARSTRTVAGNIVEATRALLRWAGVTTALGGLLGAGGLWGIDRLAISAAGQRRASSGLGITPGEQNSFGLNYGRVVSTEPVLEGVNAALTDVRQRGNLYRAGLSEQDIAGKDAAQVGVALINKLKTLADRTPNQLLGNLVGIYGLGNFGIGEQDLRRLKDRSAGELAGYERQFRSDTASLDLTPGQQTAWENFKVQLQRAGAQIEQTFIRELTPLTPQLQELSKAFTDTIRQLLGGEGGKSLITDAAIGLRQFATYVSSQSFRDDVTAFSKDIGTLAHAIHTALGWIPEIIKWSDEHQLNLIPNTIPPGDLGPSGSYGSDKFWSWLKDHLSGLGGLGTQALPMSYDRNGFYGGARVYQTAWNPAIAYGGNGLSDQLADDYGTGSGTPRGIRNNNPGNLLYVGQPGAMLEGPGGRFARFSTMSEGVNVLGRQLQLYASRGKDTIDSIIRTYAPSSENNTEQYIRDISKWTGFDRNQHLDLSNANILGRLERAIVREENGAPRRQQHVVINIYNNTGGSAIIQASAMSA